MAEKNVDATEVIQQKLAKVVDIEANLLRTVDSFEDISSRILDSTRNDLEQWYEQLPPWMHLSALLKSTEATKGNSRTIFLVHLFYLSANILVARLAHRGQGSSPPSYNDEHVQTAIGNGLIASRTIARILQLQLDEQAVSQRCWLCEYVYQLFLAGAGTLLTVTFLQIHGIYV
jgi:hypothetical protein